MSRVKTKTIRTDLIPPTLKHEISTMLQHYSVTLFGLRGREEFAHLGSGTLVKVDHRPFILTAAHCASKLGEWDNLGLCMIEGHHRLDFPVLPISIVLGRPPWSEFGPDLALIPIPYEKLGTIEARKSFHALDRDRRSMMVAAPPIEWGLWYLVGTPIESCDLTTNSALAIQQVAFLATPELGPPHDDLDYVDMVFPMDVSGLPEGFEGVSGGGLWQVNITGSTPETLRVKHPLHLEGVAFYQLPPTDGRRRIRCHSRRSVYRALLSEVTK